MKGGGIPVCGLYTKQPLLFRYSRTLEGGGLQKPLPHSEFTVLHTCASSCAVAIPYDRSIPMLSLSRLPPPPYFFLACSVSQALCWCAFVFSLFLPPSAQGATHLDF